MTTPTQQKGVSHDEKKIEAILQSQSKKDINKYFPVLASKEIASKAMKQYAEHYAKQVRKETIEKIKERMEAITIVDAFVGFSNDEFKGAQKLAHIELQALNELE